TLAIEAPALFCRSLDLAPSLRPDDAARLVADEIHEAGAEPVQVGFDGVRRQTLTLGAERIHSGSDPPPALSAEDTVVVTGGGRGVTADCVIGLAQRVPCKLILLGRTALADEPAWAAAATKEAELKAAIVNDLRSSGEKPTPRQVEGIYRGLVAQREIRATLD